jgi:hypothetical protein
LQIAISQKNWVQYHKKNIISETSMAQSAKEIAQLGLVELLYAQAEIIQSQIHTKPIMRALSHIENAIALLETTGDHLTGEMIETRQCSPSKSSG